MRWNCQNTGYNAFALIYRPGAQTACEDLARAISFIFEHADELEVDTDLLFPLGRLRWSKNGSLARALMARSAFGGDDLPQTGRCSDHAVYRPQRLSQKTILADLCLCGR